VLDGMNAEDTLDVRPGRAAARELKILSPLHDLGFSKKNVREAAKALGLPNWDKPAAACLASRVPYGTSVTPKLLSQIERAEAALFDLGFRELRVRHHGDVARLEVPEADLMRALQQREEITAALRARRLHLHHPRSRRFALRQHERSAPSPLRMNESKLRELLAQVSEGKLAAGPGAGTPAHAALCRSRRGARRHASRHPPGLSRSRVCGRENAHADNHDALTALVAAHGCALATRVTPEVAALAAPALSHRQL
jgi:hypothetical protein